MLAEEIDVARNDIEDGDVRELLLEAGAGIFGIESVDVGGVMLEEGGVIRELEVDNERFECWGMFHVHFSKVHFGGSKARRFHAEAARSGILKPRDCTPDNTHPFPPCATNHPRSYLAADGLNASTAIRLRPQNRHMRRG